MKDRTAWRASIPRAGSIWDGSLSPVGSIVPACPYAVPPSLKPSVGAFPLALEAVRRFIGFERDEHATDDVLEARRGAALGVVRGRTDDEITRTADLAAGQPTEQGRSPGASDDQRAANGHQWNAHPLREIMTRSLLPRS
jgi:hypothetical protein